MLPTHSFCFSLPIFCDNIGHQTFFGISDISKCNLCIFSNMNIMCSGGAMSVALNPRISKTDYHHDNFTAPSESLVCVTFFFTVPFLLPYKFPRLYQNQCKHVSHSGHFFPRSAFHIYRISYATHCTHAFYNVLNSDFKAWFAYAPVSAPSGVDVIFPLPEAYFTCFQCTSTTLVLKSVSFTMEYCFHILTTFSSYPTSRTTCSRSLLTILLQ